MSLNTEEELLLTPLATFAAIPFIMAARAKTRRLARLRRAREAWAEAQDRNGLPP